MSESICHPIAFFKHQQKVEIRVERERFSFKDFSERWMTSMNDANLKWHLELVEGIILPRKIMPAQPN